MVDNRIDEILKVFDDANIIVHASDGTISRWSTGCEQLYGWSRDEAKGQIASELLNTSFPIAPEVVHAHLASSGGWSGERARSIVPGGSFSLVM